MTPSQLGPQGKRNKEVQCFVQNHKGRKSHPVAEQEFQPSLCHHALHIPKGSIIPNLPPLTHLTFWSLFLKGGQNFHRSHICTLLTAFSQGPGRTFLPNLLHAWPVTAQKAVTTRQPHTHRNSCPCVQLTRTRLKKRPHCSTTRLDLRQRAGRGSQGTNRDGPHGPLRTVNGLMP